jgi:chromosome segregation ATPase
MDLHSLHRPSPPAAQQQTKPTQDSVTSSAKEHWRQTDTETELRKALARAESLASHWERETGKMDRIARAAHDKLDNKKQVKRALKAELASVKEEADKWRTRYKELVESESRRSVSVSRELEGKLSISKELEGKLARANEESRDLRDKLQKTASALKQRDSELPAIQERLKVGGNAVFKLQTLEPAMQRLTQRHAEEVAQLKEKLQTAAAQGATRVHQLEVEVSALRTAAAKTRQLELEAVSVKEKLRAATNEVSAKSGKMQACTDMLARAEQVLKTCSQLHAAKGESHALVVALNETTSNIAQFLRSVEAGKPP